VDAGGQQTPAAAAAAAGVQTWGLGWGRLELLLLQVKG
jgi:hypothetical protein